MTLEKLKTRCKGRAALGLLLAMALFTGCGEPAAPSAGEEWLVRVAGKVRSAADYFRALELAKMAYPHNALQESEIIRDIRLRVLSQMEEELLLLMVAEKSGISISDGELHGQAAALRADYPEGEFEKTLLANAVSEEAWLESLKGRLLMEKVIDETLGAAVSITPEEIGALYAEYTGSQDPQENGAISQKMVKRLRRQKAEAVYGQWLEELRRKHPVEINEKKWEEIEAL